MGCCLLHLAALFQAEKATAIKEDAEKDLNEALPSAQELTKQTLPSRAGFESDRRPFDISSQSKRQ